MATRGYQSYRGRNHGKLALVIVLVLILLAAVGYLVAQEYMVYDDEGHRHLELPFLKKGQTEQPQQPEDTTPDDVNLIIDEPERPLLKELHARQLPDPGKAAAREYLVQLCKECAELGFDEILLDYCTYPVHGRLDRIDYGSVTNLTDTLSVFVEGVREALPKTTALSVLVRDQVTTDANDGGVTLALLTEHFDRIYVDTDTVDAAALQGLLPADFDPVTRLVQVAAEAASSGSYVTR